MNQIFLSGILKNIQASVDPRNLIKLPHELISFWKSWRVYKKGYYGSYPIKILPILYEEAKKSTFDPHYVLQAYWATQRIMNNSASFPIHVDISSNLSFIVQLSAIIPVIQMEFRPPSVRASSLYKISGNILRLPFADKSIQSLSCLHVIEHIGLGRYGDPLDFMGSWKALAETKRVISKNGSFFLSVPVGRPNIFFNAGCVFDAKDIIEFFQEFKLIEFSYVDDSGCLIEFADIKSAQYMKYALGLFHFKLT